MLARQQFSNLLPRVLVVVVIGMLVTGCKSRNPGTGAAPLHAADFADGARIEILDIDIGEITHRAEAPERRWWQSVVKNSEHSSYAHGHFHGGNFRTTYDVKDGAESWTAKQLDMRPLLIALTLHDVDGNPWQMIRSYSPPFLHVDSRFEEMPRVSSVIKFGPEIIGDTAAETQRERGIELNIQYHDPDVGWVALSGPLWAGEHFPSHHVAALPVWRRDLDVLKFRLIRDNGEILHFELPAPTTPAADLRTITPEPLPVTRVGDGYEIRVDAFEILHNPGESPMLKVEPELTSTRYSVGNVMGEHLGGMTLGVRDEVGNISMSARFVEGGYIHPTSRHAEILYRVRRGDHFPTAAADCVFVAEGVVSDDGSTVVFDLLPDAAEMGIAAVAAADVIPETGSWRAMDGSTHKTAIRIEGVFPDGVVPARFGSAADLESPRMVVFEDGAEESSGVPWPKSSSLGRSSMDVNLSVGSRSRDAGAEKINYSVNIDWHAPAGGLDPGRRIRLALTPRLEMDYHALPIDLHAEHVEE